jgi:hypothetical protein
LLFVAASLTAAPAAHAIAIRIHADGVVLPYSGDGENDGTEALGIAAGAPATIDAYYDLAAYDDHQTAPEPFPGEPSLGEWERLSYAIPSPSFSMTLSVGPVLFQSDFGASSGLVGTFHTLGLNDPFQRYEVRARAGTGAGCAPACADLTLEFWDDADPFDLFVGESVFQEPNLAATTMAFAGVLGDYAGGAMSFLVDVQSFTIEVVPEPATALLLASGLTALAARARRTIA